MTSNRPSYTKESPETIQSLFDSIADNYDFGNALLSLYTHKLWNRTLIKKTLVSTPPASYLDLCSGTGEIALSYLKERKDPCTVYLLDFSKGMLDIAKRNAKNLKHQHHLKYLNCDAQQIPLPDESIDCTTIAYGIRNIHHPKKCYEETLRVLKTGGRFGILELTRPNFFLLRWLHSLYLKTLLPLLGKFATSNEEAYQYLSNSIHSFVSPRIIAEELGACGFARIKITPLLGGIATLIEGEKPRE